MHNYINQKVLITCNGWFYAPDGLQYKVVFGTLKGVHEASKTLGFIPNRSHANWFIEIGNMTIMGCQVMYIIQTNNPKLGEVMDWKQEEGKCTTVEYKRPTAIYNADNYSSVICKHCGADNCPNNKTCIKCDKDLNA